jgi:hypothetical protein
MLQSRHRTVEAASAGQSDAKDISDKSLNCLICLKSRIRRNPRAKGLCIPEFFN